MTWLVLAVITVVVLGLLVARLKPSARKDEDLPYRIREHLFSPAERSFLGVLDQAVGDQYRIFGKVRVADVVEAKSSLSRTDWQRAFNRVNAKHFDFVFCEKEDLRVICVIELDDKSHERRDSRDRDALLESVCKNISLPLVRFPAKHAYSVSDVRTSVAQAVGRRSRSSR
ncbi:MAG: DUF2726 domain-containing protein [Burkholderiales bacterium]